MQKIVNKNKSDMFISHHYWFWRKKNYKMEKEAENVDEGMVKDKARSQPWHHP